MTRLTTREGEYVECDIKQLEDLRKGWESFVDGALCADQQRELDGRWIPVTERMPETFPTGVGTAYSDAVIVWTDNRTAMIGSWDGKKWLAPSEARKARVKKKRDVGTPSEV